MGKSFPSDFIVSTVKLLREARDHSLLTCVLSHLLRTCACWTLRTRKIHDLSLIYSDMGNVCSFLCASLCNSVTQFHFHYILINNARLFTICQTNIPSICQITLISSSSLCYDIGAVFTPILESWKLKP